MRYLGLLQRFPDFRQLILSQVPADFSDWLDYVAIAVLLGFVWHADATSFAWLGVAMALPYTLFGPIAGVLVDRWPLRKLLIASNLLRGAATFLMFLAPNIPTLLAFLFLRGCFDVFYSPAKQVAITRFVPDADRMPANGLSYAIKQASKVLGPSLGAALLLVMEPGSLFILNAALSLIAATILLRLSPSPPVSRDERSPLRLWSHLAEGFRVIRGKPALLAALLAMSAGFGAIFLYDLFIPILAGEFGLSKEIYSLSIVAVGAGGVVGALATGLIDLDRHSRIAAILGAGITGLLLIFLGSSTSISAPLFLVIFAGLGISTACIMVPFRTLLQKEAGPDHIGRISALGEALDTLVILGAPLLGALIARTYGTGASFIAGGGLMLIIALLILLHRRRS